MSDEEVRSLAKAAGDGDVEAARMLLAVLERREGLEATARPVPVLADVTPAAVEQVADLLAGKPVGTVLRLEERGGRLVPELGIIEPGDATLAPPGTTWAWTTPGFGRWTCSGSTKFVGSFVISLPGPLAEGLAASGDRLSVDFRDRWLLGAKFHVRRERAKPFAERAVNALASAALRVVEAQVRTERG